jgi:phosphoserine phosphatase
MSQNKVLTLVAAPGRPVLDDTLFAKIHALLLGVGARIESQTWLNPQFALDMELEADDGFDLKEELAPDLAEFELDFALQDLAGRRKRLLVADMESTIIEQEMLDLLASRVGLAKEISAITARAMKGELNFECALKERVKMLSGLSIAVLEEAANHMTLHQGARILVQTMRRNGAYCVLVSGGFSFFSERVREACGFDEDFANRLSLNDGHLTGSVKEPILGATGKKDVLEKLLRKRKLKKNEALAVGDGANDIDMIATAGFGAGYRPKEVLRSAADACLDKTELTALLYFQGYRLDEFRS